MLADAYGNAWWRRPDLNALLMLPLGIAVVNISSRLGLFDKP